MKYSFVTFVFSDEPFTGVAERCKKAGYDGLEVPCISTLNVTEAKEVANSYQLDIAFVTGVWGAGFADRPRDLLSADVNLRSAGVKYVKECIDMANKLGSPATLVAFPPWLEVNRSPKKDLWRLAVDALKAVEPYAKDRGIKVAVEPLYRYQAPAINKVSEAIQLIEELNSDTFRILIDTFNSYFEEPSVADSIRMGGKHLFHVHLKDSNVLGPGLGNIDFKSVIRALKEISYQGYASVEFFHPYPDKDTATQVSLQYLKAVEAVVDLGYRAYCEGF